MNRQERRQNERKILKWWDKKVKTDDDRQVIKAIEMGAAVEAQDRILAMTRTVLEQQFGFGGKRLERFLTAFVKLSNETHGGLTLVQQGVNFDEFYDKAVAGSAALQQENQPGEPGDVPGGSTSPGERPL